jgi:predicted acetyltransferase
LTIKARLGLLSFLGGHRSTAHSAQWFGGHPDPFIDLIPTHVSQIHPGNWMLRIVDIVGALEQRGYPKNITAELHLEIEDDWLEWNNGRFTLEVSDGKASVRQGGEGRLPLNIRTFAGLYTGRLYSDDLKLNNAINARDGEIDVAAQVFGGPRPWMPDGF